jgi:hypothetical protein
MSPEQALGDPNLDQRSDLYSLGAVLFQMVTGSPPFDGESSQQVVGKHIAEPPPAAADVNPDVPRRLSDVILRCLAKRPAERFQSAVEVIAALESGQQPSTERSRATTAQAATELLVSGARSAAAQPTVPVARGTRPRRARVFRAGVALGLTLLTLGAGAVWLTQPRLVFENQLAGTVAVQVAGEERRLLAGARLTLRLARGEPLALAWRLVRPETSTPLGVVLGDSAAIARPRGRVRLSATARTRSGAHFAPLITNETGRPITITVNAGLAGALPCGCTVPPGAMRMEIGYYPLFANSTVRAEDPASGRTATFRDLGREVDAVRGVVGLVFRLVDLR